MIRFAGPADLPYIKRLWFRCFPDEGGFNEYFFEYIFKAGYTLVCEKDNTICAMLQMLPYELRVGESELAVTYIYGACTSPNFRRQGHMARLLERSFEIDRSEGRAATVLIPQEEWLFEFYRGFGYKTFFEVSEHIFTRSSEKAEIPVRLTVNDIPQLERLYKNCVPACHMVRGMGEWQRQIVMFDTLGRGVYGWFDSTHSLSSYAFCWRESVQEAFCVTETQAQGLLHALGTDSVPYTSFASHLHGNVKNLGCIKWYEAENCTSGYMNLMLN